MIVGIEAGVEQLLLSNSNPSKKNGEEADCRTQTLARKMGKRLWRRWERGARGGGEAPGD